MPTTSNNPKIIALHEEQINALVEWANEGDRQGGCTAYGPKFDAAFEVAQMVRDTSDILDAMEIYEKSNG